MPHFTPHESYCTGYCVGAYTVVTMYIDLQLNVINVFLHLFFIV